MTERELERRAQGRLAVLRHVEEVSFNVAATCRYYGISRQCYYGWLRRYETDGLDGLKDRSSRPHRCARQTPTKRERRVIGLRVSRRWGPARIAYRLGMQPSTVHKILRRYGCPPLAWTDPATGVRIKWARRKIHHYVHDAPGELVHVDIKKLGKIPDGGGHKVLGRAAGQKNTKRGKIGYWYLHNAVDDCTRLAYSELLTDEKKETAAEFWVRANTYFESVGITVQRVLTDNGSCYRSKLFTETLGEAIKHKRTRPYRPQTNGKVERFNRTALEEWAYARPYNSETERAALFNEWLHTYNHHRGHTALKGKSPADLVPNLRGQNS